MEDLSAIVLILFWVFVIFLLIFGNYRKFKMKDLKETYGYVNNKCIDLDNVPIFRDIPCNKDIYYAYVLVKLNKFKFKDINIISAIILKWIKEKKVLIRKIDNVKVIDLTDDFKFENNLFEGELFKMMYEASQNGLLETNEFYKWSKNYDMRLLGLFARMEVDIINSLKKETHIYYRITDEDFYYDYVMDDKIYDDSVKLYGFKKFLEEFTEVDMKEIVELHLWEDYLIFASLFGMTDKIFHQLKELCPNMKEIDIYDLL